MKDINKYKNSPVEVTKFRNKSIYIKRDDLLDDEFSGNKARKFFYFLEKDFPNLEKIISYGSPQANSLYSLSALGKIKNIKIDFYVNHIASYIKENPQGNYKKALENGVNIIEKDVKDINSYINEHIKENELFVQEGGRVQEASYGVKVLADEIKQWASKNKIENLKVALPSGTGTTALFLQKFLPFEVLTVSCVGGDEYLKKQFFELEKDESFHPTILSMPKKYHFGKLYKEFWEIYKELKEETKIEFELLYDPLGFLSLVNSKYYNDDYEILYIHQGGIIGNETMIPRYERKY